MCSITEFWLSAKKLKGHCGLSRLDSQELRVAEGALTRDRFVQLVTDVLDSVAFEFRARIRNLALEDRLKRRRHILQDRVFWQGSF
jgi:hypothetical protein